jgi:energy-coupling factor transporter ATP-binding protein EcfA2
MQDTYPETVMRGSRPSLVEDFRIEGLYGYRTIGLSSEYAATILIAKNGSGKTTLLGALDAFLKCQFGRLIKLEFDRIVCKLRNCDLSLVVTHEDIIESQAVPSSPALKEISARFGLDIAVVFDFIENDFRQIRDDWDALRESEVFSSVYQKLRFNMAEAKKLCDRVVKEIEERPLNTESVRRELRHLLSDVEIVYLPTYRRIELPLTTGDQVDPGTGRKKSVQSRLSISKRGLFDAEIRFGLSDISERLDELNQSILRNSNDGYREISANIINELLSGALDHEAPDPGDRPSKEALELFFSRLRAGTRISPYRDVVIPDIDKIYSGEELPTQSVKFLNYFLSKLNKVIKKTRNIELMVEEFVINCNRYLSGDDASATLADNDYVTYSDPLSVENSAEVDDIGALDIDFFEPRASDDKVLKLDREDLSVAVESVVTKRNVPIDSLSSGEKQMISLFARLYLYPGKKIILIDEPELSLSIDWQRKILPDMINAPTCEQVISITHSPFIFENELDPYARSLSLEIDVRKKNDRGV